MKSEIGQPATHPHPHPSHQSSINPSNRAKHHRQATRNKQRQVARTTQCTCTSVTAKQRQQLLAPDKLFARHPSQHYCLAVSYQISIAASVGDTGSAALWHDRALVGDTPKSSMEQNSSPRWPVRDQWDVDSHASYDDECDGGFEPAIPEIAHAGSIERNSHHRTTERRHTQRAQWRASPAFAGRPRWQADDERAMQSRTRDWLAAPRQYARRFETVGSAHAGDYRENYHHQLPEQLASAPMQTSWRSLHRATGSERAPILKREAVPLWPNRARTNWSSRDDWPRSARQARIQAPWRPNTGHPSYSLASDHDVSEWANDEALHAPIEANAPKAPRPRWRENDNIRLHQRHWPERSTAERPSSVRRHRWASTTKSEWQSTRSSAVGQDKVGLIPDVFGEPSFRNDSNLSAVAVERQSHERRRFSAKQDSGSRQAALGLPAWAIAPSSGPASDDDTGGGGDESLPVRLSYEQRFDADDDDDESDDEDCDDHEFELESKRQSPVSALGKTKARAKWSATTTSSRGVLVPGNGKRKQAAGQQNNGDEASTKRPKRTRCRFNGGCHKVMHSNGLCVAHGGGKRCQHAGGCGKCAVSPTSYCKAHGGGKRCQHAGGCEKSAERPTSYCIAHGGGRRCQHASGCGKSAQWPTSYCKAHGGGKRCEHAGGCGKGAQGATPYCKAHGGGYRCQHAGGCNNHAVRKKLCKRHAKAAGV
jgi:hypothetical protein